MFSASGDLDLVNFLMPKRTLSLSPVQSVYNVEMVLPVKVFPAVNWLRVL